MKTKDVLNTYAQIVAGAYPSTELNDSLTKIASEEELTPPQIEYVASAANQIVWSRLFQMDKQASYDFSLADPKKVLDTLNIQESPSVDVSGLDYMSAPGEHAKHAGAEMSALVQFQTIESDVGRKNLKAELQNRYEKLAQAQQDIQSEQIVLEGKIAGLELEFVKSARTLVLETPFSDRGEAVEKIAQFVLSAGNAEYAKTLIEKLSYVLRGQGLVKSADLKAPQQYISENLPGKIINGRHPLYITIRTLFSNYDTRQDLARRRGLVDDTLPVMREKIREL